MMFGMFVPTAGNAFLLNSKNPLHLCELYCEEDEERLPRSSKVSAYTSVM